MQEASSYYLEQCYLAQEIAQAIVHHEQPPSSQTQQLIHRLGNCRFDWDLDLLIGSWHILCEFMRYPRNAVSVATISYLGWICRSRPSLRLQWDIIFAGLLALQVARWLPELKEDMATSIRVDCLHCSALNR
jgi:hypothetical protein